MTSNGKPRLLTGDRPTGRLHLGHYVGSLAAGRRVNLRESLEQAGVRAFVLHKAERQLRLLGREIENLLITGVANARRQAANTTVKDIQHADEDSATQTTSLDQKRAAIMSLTDGITAIPAERPGSPYFHAERIVFHWK